MNSPSLGSLARIGTVFLLACSGPRVAGSSGAESSWVHTGRSDEFPREEYLVGVGRGRSAQAAEDRARAEIAKVFHARVGQVTRESERYSEGDTSRGGGGWSRDIDISQATEVETEKVLSGVEIVARHEGPDGHAALAVLSRADASDRLARRALAFASRAEALLREAHGVSDPLHVARAYYQVARLCGLIEALNQDIAVLAVREPVASPMSPGEAMEAFRRVVRDQVPVTVRLTGDEADRIRGSIESALTERGVPLASGDRRERILIRGRCAMRPNDRPPREYRFVRYEVSLEAVDAQDGTVWASVGPVSDDASGRTMDQALERAVWAIRERQVGRFLDDLFERLFGAGVEKEL